VNGDLGLVNEVFEKSHQSPIPNPNSQIPNPKLQIPNHKSQISYLRPVEKINKSGYILPIIVFAQFAGTSLWFAGNAIIGELQLELNLNDAAIGNVTSAVQLGFIVGTLIFAIFSVADRFSPAKVFLFAALAGAFFNLAICLFPLTYFKLISFRFFTGFFLAGIYPVGMKISADWYEKGLGKALGYLIGALVLGTAFPHLLRDFLEGFPWQWIATGTSILAVVGGLSLYFFVGDGPNRNKGAKFEWNAIFKVFSFKEFRAAAFGYFGHMWELYTVWAFTPLILASFNELQSTDINIPLWSFLIIGAGALGSVWGGYISLKKGSAKVAFGMLLISGICCLISPFFYFLPKYLFLGSMLIWGFTVVGDSPQFSTIVAQTAPKLYVGTALTIVNCIGFTLTIFSIQLMNVFLQKFEISSLLPMLVIGPLFGLIAIRKIL
jgi:MFS family permease